MCVCMCVFRDKKKQNNKNGFSSVLVCSPTGVSDQNTQICVYMFR